MALRFKLDENIPGDALARLRDGGHDVSTALEQRLGGALDERVLDACRVEARVLVALDLDFGDIRVDPPASHAGVLVMRPKVQSIGMLVELLRGALALAATEPISSRRWVIEPA